MPIPSYGVDPILFTQHPGYRRGVLVVEGAANGPSSAGLTAQLRQEEAALRTRLAGQTLTDRPEVAAWRAAFRAFGAKPAEHRSAVEALARRVLRPDLLPSINALVDIGNLVSIRHLLPAGVHPRPLSGTQVMLRPAREGDTFLPADGSALEAPPCGEVVFCQGQDVLTRRWTWRQAAGTQTLARTSAVYFNVDALAPISDAVLQAAMQDIEALVRHETGGRVVRHAVLDAAQPAFDAFAPAPQTP